MRFQFAGGADVPDWLLSQTFVVAKVSAVKIKLLAKLVLAQARGQPADESKLAKLLGDKLEKDEQKGVVAALHFILTSSARYDVAEDALALELQQLGLPKEHTEALVAALHDGRAPLQEHFADASLRLARLESLRWRVHADPSDAAAGAHAVELRLGVRDQPPPTSSATSATSAPPVRPLGFRLDADALTLLQAELRSAREAIEAVGPRQ